MGCFRSFILARGYPVSSKAIWWIVLLVFSLGAGAALAKPLASRKVDKQEVETMVREKFTELQRIVILFSVIGILGAFILVVSLGKGMFFFFSLCPQKHSRLSL